MTVIHNHNNQNIGKPCSYLRGMLYSTVVNCCLKKVFHSTNWIIEYHDGIWERIVFHKSRYRPIKVVYCKMLTMFTHQFFVTRCMNKKTFFYHRTSYVHIRQYLNSWRLTGIEDIELYWNPWMFYQPCYLLRFLDIIPYRQYQYIESGYIANLLELSISMRYFIYIYTLYIDILEKSFKFYFKMLGCLT